ncbi:hypothetical protein SDC9_186465 [bioreactor metagenome]|uniref:Uncharacterized protein n=1 Tax=bioreactor metagenome TaxID=1076179 RepID=A0A645HJL6_9ZZZZ
MPQRAVKRERIGEVKFRQGEVEQRILGQRRIRRQLLGGEAGRVLVDADAVGRPQGKKSGASVVIGQQHAFCPLR